MEYLPSAKELNRYLPRFFSVPLQSTYAIQRETIINEVCARLKNEFVVQLYGLSGIGKSELTKQIVSKLQNGFDLCYWLDGTSGNVHLDNIQNSEKYSVNISSILEDYKVLLVIDNLNEQVEAVVHQFEEHNKKSSICLITSQKRTLDENHVYAVNGLEPTESRKLIDLYGTNITEKQTDAFINYVKGFPLTISIACACVQKGEETWDEVIESLADLVELEDERNLQVCSRILKPVFDKYKKDLIAIARFRSTEIGANYLTRCVKSFNLSTLKSYSIILPLNEDVVYVHQMVIDSILKIDKGGSTIDASDAERLCAFLDANNQMRPIEYHVLLQKNRVYVDEVYKIASREQQKVILYACLQVCDYNELSYDILAKWNELLDNNQFTHYDCLLVIEKSECNFLDRNAPKYTEDILRRIRTLEHYYKNVTDKIAKLDLKHHIGKLYSRIGRKDDALAQFRDVIKQSSVKAYSTIYQIGQLYHSQGEYESAIPYYEQVLSADENSVPMSVMLACYGRIAKKEYGALAQKWVLDRLDVFCKVIIRMLNIDANLAIQTVGKWAYQLEYRNPTILEEFLSYIPIIPSVHSDHQTIAFLNAIRYRLLDDKTSREAQTILSVAESEFFRIPKIGDYQRKRLFELYLDAGLLDKARDLMKQFVDQNNVFNLQIFAKYFAKVGDWPAAIEKINIAIESTDDPDYKSSFIWNKACFLHEMGNLSCISTLNNAFAIRETDIPEEWENAKVIWKKEKLL